MKLALPPPMSALQECFLLLLSPEAYAAALGKAPASALAGTVLVHVASRRACRYAQAEI